MRNPSVLTMCTGLLAATLWTPTECAAQGSPPSARMTSPANGTIVNQGQTFFVTVVSATVREASVAVVSPLGMSALATSLPARIPVTVPPDAKSGKYLLSVFGATSPGQRISADPIEIDVERPDMPTSISERNGAWRLDFMGRGESTSIDMLGTFSDGTILCVRESSYMAYSSSNARVATVDRYGTITAVGIGEATIVATYRIGAASHRIEFQVTLPSLVLTTSPDTLEFGNQAVATKSAPKQLTVTNTSSEPRRVLEVKSADSDDFAVTDTCVASSPLPVGGTCVVSVTFRPSGIGRRHATLLIENDYGIFPDPIPLQGTGIRR